MCTPTLSFPTYGWQGSEWSFSSSLKNPSLQSRQCFPSVLFPQWTHTVSSGSVVPCFTHWKIWIRDREHGCWVWPMAIASGMIFSGSEFDSTGMYPCLYHNFDSTLLSGANLDHYLPVVSRRLENPMKYRILASNIFLDWVIPPLHWTCSWTV